MANQRGAIDDLPEMNKRIKKSWLELDEEFRSMIDDLPETNERTKRSWVEVLDEELGSIDYLYDSFRSNPLGTNEDDEEPGTPNGQGWLSSTPLDYRPSENGNGQYMPLGTTDKTPDIRQSGQGFNKAERLRWLTGSKERTSRLPPDIPKGTYEYRSGCLRSKPSDYQRNIRALNKPFGTTGRPPEN